MGVILLGSFLTGVFPPMGCNGAEEEELRGIRVAYFFGFGADIFEREGYDPI